MVYTYFGYATLIGRNFVRKKQKGECIQRVYKVKNVKNKKHSKNFNQWIEEKSTKIAGPLTKIANVPAISAIQDGLVAITPVIIIGSLFLILGILSQPLVGDSGKPILGFLSDYSNKFFFVNDITMGFLALYAAITISMGYGEKLKENTKTCGLLGLITFLLININVVEEGTITVKYFGATGLFVAIIVALVSVKLYKFLIVKKIMIKLPDSVPPNVGNAFASLIPFFLIFSLAWLIRSVLGFDFAGWFETLLLPFITAADNVWVYTGKMLLDFGLWGVGLHGGNMLSPIFTPFVTMWTAENATAVAAGQVPPHVWVEGMDRMMGWVATVWPLLLLLFRSKVKHHRVFAIACIPAAIFGIVEPVIFGLPLALNPFLLVPYMIIIGVTSFFSYLAIQVGLVAKFFVSLPWATPAPLLGFLASGGSFTPILLIIVNFTVGYFIFLPFFRIYERKELEKQEERIAQSEAKEAIALANSVAEG